jgi:hypothetical protein
MLTATLSHKTCSPTRRTKSSCNLLGREEAVCGDRIGVPLCNTSSCTAFRTAPDSLKPEGSRCQSKLFQQRKTGSIRGVERSKYYTQNSSMEYKVVRASFTVLRLGPGRWNSGHTKMLQLSVAWASARRLAKVHRCEIWQWRTETFRYCPICAPVRLVGTRPDREPAPVRLVDVCLPRGGSVASRCVWGPSTRCLETGMML